MSIQEYSRLDIEHPTSFEVIRTKVHQFNKVDELFFLVGVEIGERTVFLVKYCGGETRYKIQCEVKTIRSENEYILPT